jgi:hypothetical protein
MEDASRALAKSSSRGKSVEHRDPKAAQDAVASAIRGSVGVAPPVRGN